jgi:hypothetical protein
MQRHSQEHLLVADDERARLLDDIGVDGQLRAQEGGHEMAPN